MSAMHSPRNSATRLDPARIVAYSDGVFVVAATLLVVAIDIPDIPERLVSRDLPGALDHIYGQLYSFFLSFAVIGSLWIRHHVVFGRIARWDTGFVWINMLLLAFVAVLPLPTELLGRYSAEPAPVAIYAVNIILISLTLTALHRYAERRGLVREAEPALGRDDRIRGITIPVLFAASIPIAYLVDPEVAMWSWAVLGLAARLVIPRLAPGD